MRPASRASRDSNSQRSTTPTLRPASPERHGRSTSQHSSERRPIGPRSPSPLPTKSPYMRSAPELPSMDVDLALETTTFVHAPQPSSATPSREPHTPTALPRSKRQPFLPTTNTNIDHVSRGANGSGGGGGSNGVQPLSIKKKTSVRSTTAGTPTPIRRANVRNSPLGRTGSRTTPPPRRVSPQVRTRTHGSMRSPAKGDAAERMAQGLQSSRDAVSPFCCLFGSRSLTTGLRLHRPVEL